MTRLKVGFAGTPAFAAAALVRILDAGFHVPLVLTQPDRPAGRGMKLQPSEVKAAALQRGLSVAQPRSLKLDGRFADDAQAARARLGEARLDVLVVAAYGLILPRWVLDLPRLGCLNIHASLLPRWRGAAPIQRAIEAGDARTGITIMQMDEGLDTGPMLMAEALPISSDDTSASLHDRLATLGARLIVEALEAAACGGLAATPQPADGATYAHKIDKAEAPVRWADDAVTLERRVRAFDPFPGATFVHDGAPVKLWSALASTVADRAVVAAAPGTVLRIDVDGVAVACGRGQLVLKIVQPSCGRRMAVADWLRGRALAPGDRLG